MVPRIVRLKSRLKEGRGAGSAEGRQATLKPGPFAFISEVFSFNVTVKLGQCLLRLGIQTLRRVEG